MKASVVILVAFAATVAASPSFADAKGDAKSQVEFGINVAQRGLWREAIYRWQKATELDPTYANATIQLAWSLWTPVFQGWERPSRAPMAEVKRLTRTAIEHGGNDPDVMRVAGLLTAVAGDLHGGIALIEKSLALNPNSANARSVLGYLYAFAGRTQACMDSVEEAVRLNPLGRGWRQEISLALAHFVSGRYEAALEATERGLRDSPRHMTTSVLRAASLGLLGRTADAQAVVGQIRLQAPEMTVAEVRMLYGTVMNDMFKVPGVLDSLCEGLRAAGLPEGSGPGAGCGALQ